MAQIEISKVGKRWVAKLGETGSFGEAQMFVREHPIKDAKISILPDDSGACEIMAVWTKNPGEVQWR
jgi:hypothetical protein